jgi:Protein of unknown function (DUF1553)/Protein of unknown function (DUF1549)/Planctomycete cytochrome C
MSRLQIIASGALSLAMIETIAARPRSADEFFTANVAPVLEKNCFECHSHSSGTMKGGLTLDSRSGWEHGGDSGPAVVPGDLAASPLIKRVEWTDANHRMPPTARLPDADIAVLRRWVELGAPDPRITTVRPSTEWWSLKPLARPSVPPLSDHPVDAFVRARLATGGLTPVDPADRRTLIRRLSLDLHGLPPTPQEVATFVADADPEAYEKLVDRMLESPRYGERWARHWLDTIHFADTHGFEHDVFRPNAWPYRDYVIESLNRDTPWDRFVREQLATDVFYPEEPELTPALGFLGAGNYDSSAAGTAPTSFAYFDRDDLVTQTMAAFVSTTANCARCHAHKFDPITQDDYFALQADFAGVGRGDISFDPDPAVAKKRRSANDLSAAITRQDHDVLLSPTNLAIVDAWEAARAAASAWQTLTPESFVSAEGCRLERSSDGSLLASGASPDKDVVTVVATSSSERITALRLDLLTDDSLPAHGPGRASNGNLHVSEVEFQVFRPDAASPQALSIHRATSDFDQIGYGVAKSIDGDRSSSWAIHPAIGVPHHAVFELKEPLVLEQGMRLATTLRQLQGGSHLLGRFKLSVSGAPGSSLEAIPAAADAALELPAGERSIEQRLALASAVLGSRVRDELASLPPRRKVWAAARTAENERGIVTIDVPTPIHLLRRGELDKPGPEVGPGALSAIADLPARFPLADSRNEGARRAALADWIADPRNPLTWRSIVNRVFHYHFGTGLCDTPSDFGRMGGAPSHPELIDWLAVWFRDDAHGSLKALHRLLVTSDAYRRSTAPNAAASAIDPDNRLLWRMNLRRLDADSVRDSVLAISGRIDLTMGGPGVAQFTSRPGPQSTPVLDYSGFDWISPAARRRSIYRVVWRGIADPFMEALDFPDMGLLSPTRSFSASALQSLALFNDEFVLRHCEFLAERVAADADSPVSQIRELFRRVLLREPTPDEAAEFIVLVEQHGLPAACRVLFNSSEFLFVE